MKIQNSIKAAVAALLIGAAAQASATVVSINATGLPVSNYLANGTYQGSFNGASVLPTNFAINAVGFSFAFVDDTDPFAITTGASTSSSSDSTVTLPTGDKSVTTTTTITIPVTKTGETETVELSFGAIPFGKATTAGTSVVTTDTQTGATVTGTTTYAKNNGQVCTAADLAQKNSGCKATYHYSVTKTITNTTSTDYTGNIQLTDSLLGYDTLVKQLISTKSLNFDLGVTGDLNLTSAALTVDYTETPEPGTLALFGIALMGVAGLRRARRG